VPPVARGVDERESEREARQSAALESTPHFSPLLVSALLSQPPFWSLLRVDFWFCFRFTYQNN